MPRLPDKNSLQPRTDFTTPGVHIADTSGAFRGLGQLGGALAAEGQAMAKDEQGLDLIRADAEFDTKLRAERRAFEVDPDHGTYETRFGASANQHMMDAAKTIRDKKLREKWILDRATPRRNAALDSVMGQGRQRATQEKEVEVENILQGHQGAYSETQDPAERARILADMQAAVMVGEKTGLLMPRTAERMRDRFIDGVLVQDADGRINQGDAEGVLRDLGMMPGGERKPIPLVPKATTGDWRIFDKDAPTAQERREIFSKGGVVVNLDTNWAKSGRATEPMVVIPDNATPAQREAAQAYAARIADIYNEKFGTKMKPRVLTRSQNGRGRNDTIHTEPFSVTDSRAVEFFTSDEGRQLHAQALRDTFGRLPGVAFAVPHDPTRKGDKGAVGPHGSEVDLAMPLLAELSGRGKKAEEKGEARGIDSETGEPAMIGDDDNLGLIPWGEATEIDMVDPRRAQYRMMTGARRQALVHKAKTALSARTQQDIMADIARIEDGADEAVDERGETAFTRASRILSPNQLEKFTQRREAAVLSRDGVRALRHMPEEDVPGHIERIGEGLPESSYGLVRKAREKAEREWVKLQEVRRKDPAAAIAGHPAVTRQIEMLQNAGSTGISMSDAGDPVIDIQQLGPDKAQMVARQLVQASLDAQAELGIPTSMQRSISKRQAQRLINMPDPTTLPEKEVRRGLEQAAARAAMVYGPEIGEKVFADALALSFRGGREQMNDYRRWGNRAIESERASETRYQLLAKQAFGGRITDQDMRRVQDLQRLDMVPPILPGEGMNPGLPYIGQRYNAPQTGMRQPNAKHAQVLIQQMGADPKRAAEFREKFDARYGDGAAMRAIRTMTSPEGEAVSP